MAIVYVDLNATGDDDGLTWENAYPNFEDAYNGANAGDTLEVSNGTYVVTALNMADNMTIIGSLDPDQAGWVKIDGSSVNNYAMRAQLGAVLTFKRIWFYDSFANQPVLIIWTAGNVTTEDCIFSGLTGKSLSFHPAFTEKYYSKRTRYLGAVKQMIAMEGTGAAFTEQYDACIFSGGPPGQFQRQILSGTSERIWNNCIFGGTEGNSSISVACFSLLNLISSLS